MDQSMKILLAAATERRAKAQTAAKAAGVQMIGLQATPFRGTGSSEWIDWRLADAAYAEIRRQIEAQANAAALSELVFEAENR